MTQFNLIEAWGVLPTFLLLKINLDESLSFQFFFHWLNVQLFYYILIAFENSLVEERMRFNADLTSCLLSFSKKWRSLVMTSGLPSI